MTELHAILAIHMAVVITFAELGDTFNMRAAVSIET
jgi:hypothetical protein